ncbi:tail fiber domain-containing protein [Chloroflexi bacterium TSY]|nr:tail fiber domain-containing protein [Chloroflexi bacterium TSY]
MKTIRKSVVFSMFVLGLALLTPLSMIIGQPQRAAAQQQPRRTWRVTGNAYTDPNIHFLGTSDGQPLIIKTNSVEAMRVTTAGNIGIGTASPDSLLHLRKTGTQNSAALKVEADDNVGIWALSTVNKDAFFHLGTAIGGYSIGMTNDHDPGDLLFKEGSSVSMIIETGGEVGIGTTEPSTALHVSGGSNWWRNNGNESNPVAGDALRVSTNSAQGIGIHRTGDPSLRLNFVHDNDNNEAVRAASVHGLRTHSAVGGEAADLTFDTKGVSDPYVIERMRITSAGYVGIGQSNPQHPLHMASGAHVTAGGVWTNASDRNLKENFEPVDGHEVLAKLAELSVTRWNYRDEDASIKHIGPMAQDFHAAFGLGADDKHIGTVDTDGVLIAAIQALQERIDQLEAQLEALD